MAEVVGNEFTVTIAVVVLEQEPFVKVYVTV
jgi:hypothetical protein